MGKTPVPEKLWREALTVFDRNVREFWPWIAGFTLVLVPVCYFLTREFFHIVKDMMGKMQAVMDSVGGDPEAFLTNPAAYAMSIPTEVPGYWQFTALFQIVTVYCFTVFFLREEPIENFPEFSPRHFLYWLKDTAPFLGMMYVVDLLGAVLSFFNLGHMDDIFDPKTIAVTLISWLFVIRFALCVPLAVSRVERPLVMSWKLTSSNGWRFFWHWIIFNLMVGAFLLLAFIVPTIMVIVGWSYDSDMLMTLGCAIMLSAYLVVANMSSAAFLSSTCRILYAEKRKADPSFIFITQD